jgi:uncharacterized protein YbjT (DUF2867 family)
MQPDTVTVFGGTGFLGRHVVRQLCEHGFAVRVASRHPDRGRPVPASGGSAVPIAADIHDERSAAAALAGAMGAVNAVSLYVERGRDSFHAVHVEAARRVARLARDAGVERLVHVSGMRADAASRSRYISKRGEGEQAVRAAFADAVLVRPAVMFGADDAFVTTLMKLLRRLPIYPLFGRGRTQLQPVAVEDVAEAIARLVRRHSAFPKLVECAGPRVYSYEALLRCVASEIGVRPVLVPMPFAAWRALARVAELLPRPPVTRNQVELMEIDTLPAAQAAGLADLGIAPRPIEDTIRQLARKS